MGCHAKCPDYRVFRKMCDRTIEERAKVNRALPDVSTEIKQIIRKGMKK
jgi:hypothetical protein